MLSLLLLATLASAQESTPPVPPDAPSSDAPAPPSSDAPAPPPSDAPAPPPSDAPAPPAPATPPSSDAPPAEATPAAPASPAPVLQSEAPSTTVLFPVRAANLGPSEVRAAEILFRRRYETAIGRSTIDESRVLGAVAEADDKGLHAACEALMCTHWITIDLVRLDREVFVIAIERDGEANVLQRIETQAPGLDALPGVFDRVARALAARVPLEQIPAPIAPPPQVATSAAPTGATPAEAAPPDEAPTSDTGVGFKFGLHGPLWPDFQLALSHAFTYRREVKGRFFEINAGFTAPLGLSTQRTWGMVFAEVGLFHVFPSTTGAAFYAGGGFGPRIGGYDALGFGAGVYGAGGVMLGRHGSSRTYAQLKLGGDGFTSAFEPYVVAYAGLEVGVGF